MAFIPYADPVAAAATLPGTYTAYPASDPNSSQNFVNDMGGFSGSTLGASITGSASSNPNAIDPAAYNQAMANTQSAINRLPDQFNSGVSGIDSSYQNAINQLLGGYNQANQTYNQNKQTAATDYVGAKNTIGVNAGNAINSLHRLLGSRGASGGSAYNIAAPQAVVQQGTQQRNDVSNTFAKNQQGLDQTWGNYKIGYDNQVAGAGNQRDQAKQTLQSQIDTNRASLLQSLAQLTSQQSGAGAAQPYLDQANALLDKTANYSTPAINYQTQAYTPPSLASYNTNPVGQVSGGSTQAGNDYFSPYLSALLGKKQQSGVTAWRRLN